MSVSMTFRDDPRIAVYAAWIAEDAAAGKPHGDEEDLHVGVQLRARLSDRPAPPLPLTPDMIPVIEEMRTRLISLATEHGLLLIDGTGGVNEKIATSERIWQALHEDDGYSFVVVLPQQVATLAQLPDIDWESTSGLATALPSHVPFNPATTAVTPDVKRSNEAALLLAEAFRLSFESISNIPNVPIGIIAIRHLGPQLSPQLDRGVPESGASSAQLPTDHPAFDGCDVIVGAVDYGLDFLHPNFRRLGGSTRIHRMWDQNVIVNGKFREITRAEIDAAIATTTGPAYVAPDDYPYEHLKYHPHQNYYAATVGEGAHGTFVVDVACGNGRATRQEQAFRPGVAPKANIMFVQAKAPIIIGGRRTFHPWTVVWGARDIFDAADACGQPAVVNVSLNGTQGPHDGDTPYDYALDWLCYTPGRAIVVGAGNFHTDCIHARTAVVSGAPSWMTWRFTAIDASQNEAEIWYESVPSNPDWAYVTVKLQTPWGARYDIKPGTERDIFHPNGKYVGTIKNKDKDPYPYDLGSLRRKILMSFMPHVGNPAPTADENWKIGLQLTKHDGTPLNTDDEIWCSAWISRDDDGQSSFAEHGSEPMQTLGTLACFGEAIVVGAYSLVAGTRSACYFSSAGLTRDNRKVPHLAALGQDVWAARSLGFRVRYPGTGTPWRTAATMPMNGTSVSAPFVGGTVALMLQKDSTLYAAQIRAYLIAAARDYVSGVAFAVQDWDDQLGFGLLSAAEAVAQVP
jgi:subtilisin family serine protease